MGTAQCTTEAPTFDSPVEFPHSRFGKYVKFCCNVTCALAHSRPARYQWIARTRLLCLLSGRTQCAGPEKLFDKQWPGTRDWRLGVTGGINCCGNFSARNAFGTRRILPALNLYGSIRYV